MPLSLPKRQCLCYFLFVEIVFGDLISISLKSPLDGREQGENLFIQISLDRPTAELEMRDKLSQVLSELDHHHLSEDKNLRIKSFAELILWLDKRLSDEGLSTKEMTIRVNSEMSLSLK